MRIGNIRFNGGAVVITSLVVLVLMSGIFFLSASSFAESASPEIFFHVEKEVTTDVTIRIENGVTKTIPEISLGREVTWEEVTIREDGKVNYQGNQYPFLYYEGIFSYPESYYGWLFERTEEGFILDGSQLQVSFEEFIMNIFIGSGLCENEADYLLERMITNDMLKTSEDYLIFRYIPMNDVDEAIELTTSFDLAIMRRHFVIQECVEPVEMVEPEFENIEDNGYIIHETAINRF